MEASYITSVAKPEQLKSFGLSETAFVGRSNTGKSTLINTLVGRRNLARKGKVPGQTQMINFFKIGKDKMFVDLPGFGYTEAQGLAEKKGWDILISSYLKRPELDLIIFLADIRREIPQKDLEFLKSAGENVKLVIALTKADKLARSKLNAEKEKVKNILTSYGIIHSDIIPVSSLKKYGIEKLREMCLYMDAV